MDLVVGATGSLGSHITLRLLREGRAVRTLVREASQYSKLQASGAEIALGDLKNRRSLDRACVGVKTIIGTATAAARGGPDTIAAVDLQGYVNLLTAAEAAGVKRFVFVSAHGFEADSPVELARAKVATENALRASKLDFTILRPALFMESWIGMIVGAQLQSGSKVIIMGDADQQLPFVSATNVADLAIAVLDRAEASRTSVSLSAQTASYRQIVDWIGAATGREIELSSVPAGTLIPGLPPSVVELWTMAATRGFPPIETVGVAVNYGLKIVTPKAFVDRVFRTPSAST